ncbi:MAG TPA: type I glyceraldehyde-3-phosphate dehydrogenase [Candidatus Baltobacteraceae bacterium]|nr:type I glyceraldehyde-3-phosphate dehydrogenase [Candidatus Baltobacteraceae bacterium]
MPNYAINGFGRIGRNVLRAMTQKQVEQVRAINDLTDTQTLAHLLKWDSVHGKFDGEIGYDEENIIVRGHKIRVLKERDPANLPWKKLDIDVVLESTGLFTSRDKAELHLSKAGAKRVLISAPAKDPDVTICMGVNDQLYDPAKHHIVSNASCTTNCLAPLAKVLNDKFGIAHGFMSTIHSYTNDQRILDFPHKDLRRARAAAINIIPSTTGAAKAIGEVIPELKGKLNGGAFRVPTPDGSVTDFTAVLEKDATVDTVNAAFKEAASDKSYKGVVEYSDEPLVSQDIVENPHSCIFDSKLTLMLGNRFVKVVGWYDNEWGYSTRCVELMELLGR